MTDATDHITAAHAPPRVGFVSLGCPKATVDSERILGELTQAGYAIATDYQGADVVVVNTCGFIDAAREESFDAIDEALNEHGRVVVTGCLGAEHALLQARFPELLAVTRPHDYAAVLAAVKRAAPIPAGCDPIAQTALRGDARLPLTPPHYAYLKVSEGCNHSCRFCIIPSMRGPLVSRDLNGVVREAERLVDSGVREILVIAQDLSAYGVDLGYARTTLLGQAVETRFETLCRALDGLGVWVRLHYVYPYPHVDAVIPLMRHDGLLPYLDIPLQHGAPRVLKAMRRPAAAEHTLERIQGWRTQNPDLVIRSSFIVGFPGETEADFMTLLDFLDEAALDRVGCFQYSPVAGAAANALPNHVSPEEMQARYDALMAHQKAISARRITRLVGRELDVLVDEVDGERVIGRSYADAPDIDGQVYISFEEDAPAVGSLVRVRIDASDDYDLWGHTVGAARPYASASLTTVDQPR